MSQFSEKRQKIILSLFSHLQSSQLGLEARCGFMGVWKTIYENFRHQECEYCHRIHFSFSHLPPKLERTHKKNHRFFSLIECAEIHELVALK
jgi:hypothetical protein